LRATRAGSQTKLAKAIREDGENEFSIEVLQDGIDDPMLLRDREIYWVKKLGALGSNGLNSAPPGGLGGAKGTRTIVDGEAFRSLQEAAQVIAERLSIPEYAVRSRIKSGKPIPIKVRKNSTHPEAGSPLFRRWLGLLKRHPNAVELRWVESYDDFKSDISPLDLSLELLRKDDTKAWGASNFKWVSVQEKINISHGISMMVKGISYPSFTAVAIKFGIGSGTLRDRIERHGMSLDAAVDVPLAATSYKLLKTQILIDGKSFRSRRQASIYLMTKGLTEYQAQIKVNAIVATSLIK
jgi:hypothetical protein